MAIRNIFKKPSEEKKVTPVVQNPEVVTSVHTSSKGAPALPLMITPMVTEKSTMLATLGQYCLKAPFSTTKPQIRSILQQVFHVHPKNIRMIPVAGSHVRYGASRGTTKKWKKFMVQLPKEEKLNLSSTNVH